MSEFIKAPCIIKSVGTKPKVIEEYFGRVNSHESDLSIARMKSPEGWQEPGQTPSFDEYTVVLKGTLRVEFSDHTVDVVAGQAIHTQAGEWVRYSSPIAGGAEYMAVCLPAFSPQTVHRDKD